MSNPTSEAVADYYDDNRLALLADYTIDNGQKLLDWLWEFHEPILMEFMGSNTLEGKAFRKWAEEEMHERLSGGAEYDNMEGK